MGRGSSLVVEDSRVYGSSSTGLQCCGDVKATRCTFEDSTHWRGDQRRSLRAGGLAISKNGAISVLVSQCKLTLKGGTISENKDCGVYAREKITVAKAEEGKPQTVCKDNGQGDNGGRDWVTDGGEIIGIPQEKIYSV